MKKVEEYLRYAEECRAIAAQSNNPEHKTRLTAMAATWEILAEMRRVALAKKSSDSEENSK